MKKASITETKNNLSRLIEEVRNGTSILILDRNVPVAKLEPISNREMTNSDWTATLVRQGLAEAPHRPLDIRQFLSRKKARLKQGSSAVQALLAEREESQ